MKSFIPAILFLCVFASCVPTRKYTAVRDAKAELERKLRDANDALRDSKAQYASEAAKNDELTEANRKMKRSFDELQDSYNQTLRLKKEIEDSYNKLLELNRQLTSKASSDAQSLQEQQTQLRLEMERKQAKLDAAEADLRKREREMADLERDMKDREAKIANLEGNVANLQGNKSELEKNLAEREKKVKALEDDLADRERRLKELEDLLNEQKAKSQELKNRIKQALRGFESTDITVEEKDGKVYVSLSQQLLFASGSKTIDKKGKEALSKLAEVLNKNTDIFINVEGHTDSDGEDLANWDLSVGRAVSITNELTKNKVDPTRITASGRGEHHPVAPNTSNDGKAKNRRTEIILSPDLSDLYELLK